MRSSVLEWLGPDHCFFFVISTANKQRSVGSTLLNRESSRSHAILTLEVKLTKQDKSWLISSLIVDGLIIWLLVLIGKINLVDLAGSENNKVCVDTTTSALIRPDSLCQP
jgi:kinesin family protein 22